MPLVREHYGESRQTARALMTSAAIHARDRQKARADAEYREAVAMFESMLPPGSHMLVDARKQYTTFCKRFLK